MQDKLELVERSTGKRPPALDHEDIPLPAIEAWNLWSDLNAGRTHNGNAHVPLSWLDIDAWSRIRKRELTYTELELVRTFDAAYVASANKKTDTD